MKNRMALLAFTLLLVSVGWTTVHDDVGREMLDRALHFLVALEPARREQATFAFDDEERFNWHFTPVEREGLPYQVLTPAQRRLADRLIGSALSREGINKALGIMYLDQILYERERADIRDPDRYYFSFFGELGDTGPWGWRIEGHHLSLNFTLQDGRIVSTSPAFMGSNPAIVREGPHAGLEVLAEEQHLGRELLHMFEGEARAQVVFAEEAPRELFTSNSRRADIGAPIGVAVRDMTPAQAEALMDIVRLYIGRMRDELAHSELEKIMQADVGAIHFAWAGGGEPGDAHYYRVHGPTFLIEYDNMQNDANHVHSVWRDLTNDWGYDVLAAHYAVAHAD